ncbi:hypothetical protein GSI_04052 [Ganoderma sinense ZZ0214-1]|uniref:Fungal-type protein kinase domain-containing protein n=1 Tax=Ganoderma sinense ZZ0214-1 TaxID=1077348 RepID=A0A2G8SI47_9APHY|nr:hypothetical protein GSI_04052 [Ganoderma sinense ZZ0214-1]
MPPRSVSFAEGTLQHSDSPGRYNRANAPASNTLPNLEENRAELRCNMHGKITLLPVKTFLETFFPSIDIEEPAQPNIFHNMKTPTSERQMYEDLPRMLNAAGITSKFTFVATPYQSDQADPSKQSVDCGMYLNEDTPEPENGAVYARVDWSNLDLSIECKYHPTDQDPLDDAKGDGEPTADKRQEALGQILSYAELVFRYQHRMFHFMILFLGTEARIVRFDRSGIFATHKFSLKEEGHWLVEFLCAYTALSPVERGYDPTVTRVVRGSAAWKAMKQKADTVDDKDQRDYVRELFKSSLDEEWPWWLIEVHPEPSRSSKRQVKRRYLVGKPHFQAPGVAGRGTRGYVALPATAKGQPLKNAKFVYLKDAWRVDHANIDQEGKILKYLNDSEVPYVPTLVSHGDVPSQVTLSQELWSQFHSETACPLKRHTHYRLVVAEVGMPLDAFGDDSCDLVAAVHCCIQAHAAAYKAGIIHRDISSGNLLLYKGDDNEWYGLLNDWELSKKVERGPLEGRQPDRTGTWQFMSAHALNDPLRKMVIQDELESFFHVLLHYAIRYLPHNLKASEVGRFLHDYFDAAGVNSDGIFCCGKTKKAAMRYGVIDVSEYNGDRDSQNTTLRFFWPTRPCHPPQRVETPKSTPPPSFVGSSPPRSPAYKAIFDPYLTPLPSDCTPPPQEDAEMEGEAHPEHPPEHPLNRIIDKLLSWFKAYYSFDVAMLTRTASLTNTAAIGRVPTHRKKFQNIRVNKHKSDEALAARARGAVNSSAQAQETKQQAAQAKRVRDENEALSANLQSHDAILALFDDVLEDVWPVGDRQADKKPAKGYVRPKRQFPQGSTTSRSGSKRRTADEEVEDASEHKPSKRSRP